jgi:hypothetical protein
VVPWFAFRQRVWLSGAARLPWTQLRWRWASMSVGLTFALAAGCSDTSPPPFELVRVSPSIVHNNVDTNAVVEGKQFYDSVKLRLNDNAPATIDHGWDVSVDADRHLNSDQTLRIDSTALSIVLPAGLALGPHHLSVRDPRGQSRTLMNAFTVVADGNSMAPNASGGATSSISSGGTASLSDGGSSGNTPLSSGGTEATGGTTGIAGSGNSSTTGGADATGGIMGTAGGGNAIVTSGGTQAAGGTTSSSSGRTDAAGGFTGIAGSSAASTSGGTDAVGGITGKAGSGAASTTIGGTQATAGITGTGGSSVASTTNGGTDTTGGIAGMGGSSVASTTSGGTRPTGSNSGVTDASAGTCSDGIQNGNETEVDCGGSDCPVCVCELADFSSPSKIVLSDRADITTTAPLWSPTLSADGLTMFFAASVGGTERIYQTTRTTTTSLTFANTKAVFTGVTDNRGTPALSYDGLTLYFYSSGLGGAGSRDIWAATRLTVTASFGTLKSTSAINTSAMDHLPWVSADELTMYYISDSSGSSDIWMTHRASRLDAFGAGSRISELNSSSVDSRAALTSDGRVAYFSSDRARAGYSDIWVAVRSTGGTFSTPTLVVSLNSTAHDTDLTLSRDDTETFFSSDRDGTYSIYRALRQCK